MTSLRDITRRNNFVRAFELCVASAGAFVRRQHWATLTIDMLGTLKQVSRL